MTLTKPNQNKYLIISLTTAFLAVLTFFLGSVKVSALTLPMDMVRNQSPHSATSNRNTPFHNLILSWHGRVERIQLGVYSPTREDITFSLNLNSAECEMRDASGYVVTRPYVIIEAGGNTIQRVDGNQVCGWLNGRNLTIPASSLTSDYRSTGKFGATLTIRWVNDGDLSNENNIRNRLAAASNGQGSRFRFRVDLEAGKELGLIETHTSSIGNTNNSMVHESGGYADMYYPFGARCSENAVQNRAPVTVYDADNGLPFQSGGDNLYFWVGTTNQNTGRVTPLRANEYQRNASNNIVVNNSNGGTNNGISRAPASMHNNGTPGDNSDDYPIFTPRNYDNAGGSTTVYIASMQPDVKYVLVVMHQHAGQFVYIGAPGDAIFGSPNFRCVVPPVITPHVGMTGTYEPGGTVDATAWVTKPGGTSDGTSNYQRIFWYEEGANDQYNAGTDALVAPGRLVNSNATYTANSTPINPTWSITIPANTTRKRICTSLQLSNPGPAGASIGSPNPDRKCENIVKRPYFRVENGDVNAAGALPTACTPGTGTISAFNRGSNTWLGSGTQIAAYSRGLITEFTSGANAGTPPKRLSFANSGGASGSTTYGGSFGPSYCMPDYWANITTTANQAVGNSAANVLTRGDVRIDSNYTVGGSHALDALPVRWVVADDIYISSAVTELDGIYIARRNIYTCSNTTGFSSVPVTGTQLNIQCSTQLKVRGAMIAGNSIKLQRTYGTLALAPNFTAETIEYNPFVWMSVIKSSTPPPVGTSGNKFDFITTLPPVL